MASRQRGAVVLLSGGLDSATVAAIARDDGYYVHALSLRYGQRHEVELAAAAQVARALGLAEHRVVDVDLAAFGGSALTGDVEVPKSRSVSEIGGGIPVTYVPARNTVFLALALAHAEVVEASDIFVGVNAVDYSGYPDCRPEYLAAFQAMARLATKRAVESAPGDATLRIHAPLIEMSKAEIIERGSGLGLDYSLTVSCYDPTPDGRACGACDSCLLRQKGFAEAGLVDPTRYS